MSKCLITTHCIFFCFVLLLKFVFRNPDTCLEKYSQKSLVGRNGVNLPKGCCINNLRGTIRVLFVLCFACFNRKFLSHYSTLSRGDFLVV